MEIRKISLENRIQRIKEHSSAYPEYVAKVFSKFAKTPLSDYLSGFPKELKTVQRKLGITEEEAETITYQEMAYVVYQKWMANRHNMDNVEVVFALMVPFQKYFEERSQNIVK